MEVKRGWPKAGFVDAGIQGRAPVPQQVPDMGGRS